VPSVLTESSIAAAVNAWRLSGMLLILGGAHTFRSGIPLAHVRASLGLAVRSVPRVVIDL
jgi:hypothetical protein